MIKTHNEEHLLGQIITCMQNTGSIDTVSRYVDMLDLRDFEVKEIMIAIDHIKQKLANREAFDLVTLYDAIEADPRSLGLQGFGYYGEIASNATGYASIETTIKLIKSAGLKRNAARLLESFHAQVTSADEPMQTIGQLESAISELLGSSVSGSRHLSHIKEVGKTYIDQLQRDFENPNDLAGLTTGFAGLDELLGARLLRGGSLLVTGGRPGMGKSALMTYLASAAAINKPDKSVLVYSMEMPKVSVYERMMLDSTGYNYEDTIKQFESVVPLIAQASHDLAKTSLYISDKANMTVEQIKQDARQMHRIKPVSMICIDYLTIMALPKADRHDLRVGEVTRQLKQLAIELDCVVCVLAQLNRSIDSTSRKNKRPNNNDLRDAGQIEQDADYILFPYRDIYYNEGSPAKNYVELILSKNRHGMIGTAFAEFDKGRFVDCDQQLAMSYCNAAKDQADKQPSGIMD